MIAPDRPPAPRRRPLAPAVLVGLALALAASACGRRPRPPRPKTPIPAELVATEGVALTTRAATIEALPGGGQVVEWRGLARNDGAANLGLLTIDVVALAADGRELGRDHVDAVGLGAPIGWLQPGASAQVAPRSQSVLHAAPAALRVEVSQLGVADRPAAPALPLDFTWRAPPPAGAAIGLRIAWCGAPSALAGGRGRVPFDCQLGVENLGDAPIARPTVEFVFEDGAGAVVDRLRAAAPGEGPIDPGVVLAHAATRAVEAHARWRVELTPGAAAPGL